MAKRLPIRTTADTASAADFNLLAKYAGVNDWEADILYTVGETVIYNYARYMSVIEHTSNASFFVDYITNAYWAPMGAFAGEIKKWTHSTVVPVGWLVCDGRTLGKEANDTTFPDSSGSGAPTVYGTQYETLYKILSSVAARWEIPAGTATWGTHKIYLPNLQDAVLRGEVGLSSTIFTDSTKRGAGLGKKQDDAMQGHYHDFKTWTGSGSAVNRVSDLAVRGTYNTDSSYSFPDTVQSPITDGTNGTPRTATETRMKNVGISFIIKY